MWFTIQTFNIVKRAIDTIERRQDLFYNFPAGEARFPMDYQNYQQL